MRNIMSSYPACLIIRNRRLIIATAIGVALLLMLVPARPFSAQSQLPAPVLVNPPDGQIATVDNYPPAAVPHFEWRAVPGTKRYRIQIDDQIGFNDPVMYNEVTGNTRYIPIDNNRLQDGTWYWRVRVENWVTPTLTAGDWSGVWQFSKRWGSTDNAPTLLAPEAYTTIEFIEDPIFSWTPVTGAADYAFRIYSDPNCSSRVRERLTLATHYNLTPRLTNGTYYWRVAPRDPTDREGQPSECRQVTIGYNQIPRLLEPANYSEPVHTPRFRWTAVKGAYAYNLYYGTTESFQEGTYTRIAARQTSYTPDKSLPNDTDYFWKVAAVYGSNVEGPPSQVWRFRKKWYHRPINLTPRNTELTNVPLFTWTPVREAKYYEVELNFDPGFDPNWQVEPPVQTANTFYWQTEWCDTGDPRYCEWSRPAVYWRVTPYDNNGNPGQPSQHTSFVATYTLGLPEAIYPRYFYQPPSIAAGDYITPYNIPTSHDYTLAVPTFYWTRTFVPPKFGTDAWNPFNPQPRVEAHHYKIEVDDDPNFFSVDWSYKTRNLSATPTDGTPFEPEPNKDYYWRVTPYAESGRVLTRTAGNEPWKTQIDLSRLIIPITATISPELQSPPHGEMVMDTLPSFQWLPQQGAVRYEFMLSADPAFTLGTIFHTYVTRTIYTQHTPPMRLPNGTYFWRVRGLDEAGDTVGDWSSSRRLIVGHMTRWNLFWKSPPRGESIPAYPKTLITATQGTLLATDPDEKLGMMELTSLYAAQDMDHWYVGFHANPAPGSTVWYGLYIDGDQADGSGAPTHPPNRPTLGTPAYYRPEFALYAVYSGNGFITTTHPTYGDIPLVYLHRWDPTLTVPDWDPQVKNLANPVQVAGGSFYYSPTLKYVELGIPKTAIGDLGAEPFALSIVLFSASSEAAKYAVDSVPDNGFFPSALDEFASIADRITPSFPPHGATLPNTPYVYAEVPNTDWLDGYLLETAEDPIFPLIYEEEDVTCVGCWPVVDIFQYVFTPKRIYKDRPLYWRFTVKHRYLPRNLRGIEGYSPPSEPYAFNKAGLRPGNLREESDYSTPTFAWDAVEGAAAYKLEVATNPDFSPLYKSYTVNHDNYTPLDAFAPGRYYWRVRAENRHIELYQSNWSLTKTVNVTLPTVSLVEPPPGAIVNYAPTFEWQGVLTPTDQPAWGTTKYHLQIDDTDKFDTPVEDIELDTVTWTPFRGYKDGAYYWRVAAMDAEGKEGLFSPVYTFTKQYPAVKLISPFAGASTSDFPTFIWTSVEGAARYKIEISKNPQFSPLYDQTMTHNTWYTPKRDQPYDQATYYWRVAMIDKNNNYGPWTDSIIVGNRVYLPVVMRNF